MTPEREAGSRKELFFFLSRERSCCCFGSEPQDKVPAYLPPKSPSSSSTSSSAAAEKSPLRWALAGRSLPKLEALRSELAEINPAASAVPLLVASLDDAESLDAAVGSARCVISAAGPYAEIGSEVVASAVRCGTHYADLTAEIPWVLSMHQRHAAEAIEKDVKIVHSAGFDSQPSDFSVVLLAKPWRAARTGRRRTSDEEEGEERERREKEERKEEERR